MGKIADDMIRLCGEIQELRTERRRFVREIRSEVVKIRAGFRKDFEAIAKRGRAERAEIVRDLQAAREAWALVREPAASEHEGTSSEHRSTSRTSGGRRGRGQGKTSESGG